MDVTKILDYLKTENFNFSKLYLEGNRPIEAIIYEPHNIQFVHNHSICICSSRYFNAIKGHYEHIVYFVIPTKDHEKLERADNMIVFHESTNAMHLYQTVDNYFRHNFRIETVYSSIGQCLLQNTSIDDLLKTGAEILGNPIMLSDLSTRLIGVSSTEDFEDLHDELLECMMKNHFVTADLFKKYNYSHLLPYIGSMEKAQIFLSDYPEKLNRITTKVLVNNQYFGWIIIPEAKKKFSEEDPEIADIIANGISLLLNKRNSPITANSRENLFLELLSGTYLNEDVFYQRTGGFKWDIEFPVRIIAIAFDANDNEKSLLAYKNPLSLLLPSQTITYYRDTLFILVEESSLTFVANTLSTFLENNHLIAGCSCRFDYILDMNQHAIQAVELMKIGHYLHPKKLLFNFEDYMLYYNAWILKKNGCAKYYLTDELLEIRDYDYEFKTKYCESIRAWLNFRNLAETAKYLGIHRNTMVYRYDKFQELTGIDLSGGDAIYHLNLAFLIWDLEDFNP